MTRSLASAPMRFVFLVLTACFTALSPASARAATPPEVVARALARAGIPQRAAAFYVHEIGASRPLLAIGANRALNPASTIKLLTTFAALELLGPAYRWSTEAYVTGNLARGVLAGDLILKGYGDPKLTLENFWLLLRDVRARGLREIRGDLVLDRSYFALDAAEATGLDDKPMRPYNTAPDALLLNFKSIRVQFVPDPVARALRIITEPDLPQVRIVNNVVLDGARCGYWEARLQHDLRDTPAAARLLFAGRFAAACGERERYFSVLRPSEYAHGLFQVLWHELGGTFSGGVREGEAGPNARLLYTWKSQTLAETVRDINKFSNNVMARQLFLTLGAAAEGAPATTEKSVRAIRQWLDEKGLAFPELVLENGAGLSRIERLSARSLGQLLLAAYRSPLMPELIASLPLAASDGTMKKRVKNDAVAGHAHMKTGTLDDVRAIAGYLLDAQGRRMVVVFIVNHQNAQNAHPVEDALLNWVYHRDGQDCCRSGR
jgi:D-alanyl-D-alanine carboxypeptidase/D-alanyl-D-alanine-endopeptidase (penicillin-binding protein 4)